MSDWYQVTEGDETVHVRTSNSRTAFDRGFRLLCGMDYKIPPGETMAITCTRLRGGSEQAKLLEQVYQETRQKQKRHGG
jgi:hypothetical protein